MAMYLTAHSLFEKGDYVIVEEPGYKPAWKAFESAEYCLLMWIKTDLLPMR